MRIEILGIENADDDSLDELFKIKLEDAKYEYLRLVYPFHPEIDEVPDTDRFKNWQTKCAIELYNLMGEEDWTSYSENGLQIVKSKAGLSKDLLNELPPCCAGVPK